MGSLVVGSLGEVRSNEELRARFLDTVAHALRRPGMFAIHDVDLDRFFGRLFADLCFLDGADDREEGVRNALTWYGQMGVAGPFRAAFGRDGDFRGEVASVWAEILTTSGYCTIAGSPVDMPWESLLDTVTEFDEQDARASDVRDRLGQPTLVIDDRVYCYAPADYHLPWVFCDFVFDRREAYVYGTGRNDESFDPDPLLRNVRVPSDTFRDGLVLTAYGKLVRWGPQWWVSHASEPAYAEVEHLASRVRQVTLEDHARANVGRSARR
jgi:hypothetical protein